MSDNFTNRLDCFVKYGLFAVPFLVLMVFSGLMFPFITSKGFFFRILIEVLFGAWAILVVLRPRKYLPQKNILTYAVLIFVFTLFLADIFGVNFYKSFWSNYERMDGLISWLHLIAFFFILISMFRKQRDWFIFFHISIFVSLLVSIYAYFEYFDYVGAGSNRVIATIGNPIYLAAYLLLHFFIIAFWGTRAGLWKWRLGYFFIFLFEFPIFLLTGSRGAFLGLVGGICCFALLKFFAAKKTRNKLLFAGLLLFFVSIPLVLLLSRNNDFVASNRILNRFSSISFSENTVQSRFIIWNMAIKAWAEKPFLGWGQENFISVFPRHYDPKLYGNERWFDRPHNIFLQFLVDAGILGLWAYLFIFCSAIFILWRICRRGHASLNDFFIICGFLAGYVLQAAFVFDTLTTNFILMAVLAFIYFLYSSSQSDPFKIRERTENNSPAKTAFSSGIFCCFLIVFLSLFGVAALNFKPLKQATAIVKALDSVARSDPSPKVIQRFKEMFQYNSFGQNEAREQGTVFFQNNPKLIIGSSASGEFLGLFDAILTEMEHYIAGDPLNVRPRIFYASLKTLGAVSYGSGFPEAEKNYFEALEMGPKYLPAYVDLIRFYLIGGKPDAAARVAQKAMSLNPDSLELRKDIDGLFMMANRENKH